MGETLKKKKASPHLQNSIVKINELLAHQKCPQVVLPKTTFKEVLIFLRSENSNSCWHRQFQKLIKLSK